MAGCQLSASIVSLFLAQPPCSPLCNLSSMFQGGPGGPFNHRNQYHSPKRGPMHPVGLCLEQKVAMEVPWLGEWGLLGRRVACRAGQRWGVWWEGLE